MSIEDSIKRLKEAHAEHLAGHDDGGREYLAACTPDVVGYLLARVAPRPADPEAIARLREALAAGPTPGPWHWEEGDDEEDMPSLVAPSGQVCWFGNGTQYYPTEGEPPSEADAALIAACSPEVLAHLLAALDEREALRGLAEFLDGSAPLDGLWFGEQPTDGRGKYWWRSYLPAARKEPT